MDQAALWKRYQQHRCPCSASGLTLDISRMTFDDGFFDRMGPDLDQAYDAMERLEAGTVANPDENRMVGHYWLRAPSLAPRDDRGIGDQITTVISDVESFAADVHAKRTAPPSAPRFTDLLLIGIGGSALGPQLVANTLATKRDKLAVHFLDNTDPDGVDRVVAALGRRLKSTLVLVISKSGGTPETRNCMLEIEQRFAAQQLDFATQAVAVTRRDSRLDVHAQQHHWRARFPMWDWVGGRTSVLSAVGLLPAALQGVNIRKLLEGAAEMDECTRRRQTQKNPAALMALMWHHATDGRGNKDMVMLPYKDRLILLSRYLQQLVMESLGKGHDLDGRSVFQGIAVYGNKGSTDQHAYVQQLRDGLDNFFVTFVVVLQDRIRQTAREFEVEPGHTSGDYLHGFWLGTREALYEKGRQSITITVNKLDARSLGALIALFERAVGFYASLININAYHQPGVEAGKKAAAQVLDLQAQIVAHLAALASSATPDEIAQALGCPQKAETIYHILEHLAANQRGIARSHGKYRVCQNHAVAC